MISINVFPCVYKYKYIDDDDETLEKMEPWNLVDLDSFFSGYRKSKPETNKKKLRMMDQIIRSKNSKKKKFKQPKQPKK